MFVVDSFIFFLKMLHVRSEKRQSDKCQSEKRQCEKKIRLKTEFQTQSNKKYIYFYLFCET